MGLLLVYNDVFINCPDTITAAFIWLRIECKAEVNDHRIVNQQISEFYIEGEGIPIGRRQFTLRIDEIVPNVLIVGPE